MRANVTIVASSELRVGWRFKAGILLFALSLVP
jgi:hypothetical protein